MAVDLLEALRALLLVAQQIGLLEGLFGERLDATDEGLVLGRRLPIPLWLAGLLYEPIDGIDGMAHLLMAKHHRTQHDVFGELVGLRLHHEHGRLGARHDKVETGGLQLSGRGVEHVLVVYVANTRCTDGAIERDARNGQRSRRANHGHDVRVDLWIEGHHGADHLHLVVEAFWKERPDGPVDQTRREGLLLAGASFPLEKAAWNLAGGIGLFLVIDGEREKILARFRCFCSHDRGKHHGVFDVDEHGAAGLTGNLARFNGDRLGAVLEGFFGDIEHVCSFR